MKDRVDGQPRYGRGWVDGLCGHGGFDPGQLIRGRAYARGDRVSEPNLEPGLIEALVQGGRPRPYAVIIAVPVFSAVTWTRLIDLMAAEIGHLAALLDGDLTPEASTGWGLFPGASELEVTCSGPECTGLCRHAAAVCYLAADAFDADPFAVLLLRGRTRAEILAALRERRKPVWSSPEGMLASEAYRRNLPPLPPLALPPHQPGSPAPLPAQPPAASGVSAEELAELATFAARRAWRMLDESGADSASM